MKQSKAFANVAGLLLQSSNKKQPSGQVLRVRENRLSLKHQQQKRKRSRFSEEWPQPEQSLRFAFNVVLLSLSYAKIMGKIPFNFVRSSPRHLPNF